MKRFWITLLLCLSGIAVAAGITAISGLSSLTNQQEEIKSTSNGLWSFLSGLISGERNPGSTTGTDYLSTSAECWPVTVDTSTDSTTVYNGPAVVQYVYVNTVLSAHTVLLVDGATTKITLPASLAAGSSPNIAGTMFRTSLVVDPDNASTGNITVCFRPLDAGSTWTP